MKRDTRRVFGRLPARKPAPCLSDREAEWAAALLCGDAAAMARIAGLPLPIDAPAEARERWGGRRGLLAAAGVMAAA